MTSARNWVYNLLRRSESFFKTDMVYLAKGGLWLTSSQVIASFSSFLLAIAFANLLPKETYGTYKFILALGSALTVFTLTGMNTAVTQAVARGLKNVLVPAFKTKVHWGLLGSLVSFAGAIYYYINGNITLSLGLIIIGLFMPPMESSAIYNSIWHGSKRFDISAKYSVVSQIGFFILLISALFFTDNVLILVLIYFSSWTLFRYIFYRITLSKIDTDTSGSDPSAIVSYGKHLSLMDAISVLANYADKILVFHYVGAAEAAIYSIAVAIPEQLKGMLKIINPLALPKFSQKTIGELRGAIGKKMMQTEIVSLIMVAAYLLLAPTIYRLLFPQYLESIVLSQVFALSLLFVPASQILAAAFLSQPQLVKKTYTINILTGILLIILLISFGYLGGTIGIIYARILHVAISLALGIVLWRRTVKQTN